MLMNPYFNLAPHHRMICDELMALERGTFDRLMIFISPRSSKSTISSIYYPSWCIGRNPQWEFLAISHSDDLSTRFGREVRDIIDSKRYQQVFPNVRIKKNDARAGEWSVTDRGNVGGRFLSAGIGSKLAGHGAHIITLDDPISEQEAFSITARTTVNNLYPGGVRSRLMPQGRIVIVQTRWMEDDLSGYLLDQAKNNPLADKWRVIKIPALNDIHSVVSLTEATLKLKKQGYLSEDYPLPKLDESFWPAPLDFVEKKKFHWNTEALLRTKNNLPSYQWDAIYMQEPSSQEGGILKRAYWLDWEEKESPECTFTIHSWDTAFSQKDTADYSALTKWGVFKNDKNSYSLILLGAKKERFSYPELREYAIEQFNKDQPTVILVEKKASGQSLIQDLRLASLPVMEYQPDRDKVARAHSVAPLFVNGRIYAPLRKKWAEEVIEECRKFPKANHDDYVDTVTQALIYFRNGTFVSNTKDDWISDMEEDIIHRKKRKPY
jgi:predicted phage terminase large subunit-like protein